MIDRVTKLRSDMDSVRAEELVRQLAQRDRNIIFSEHATERMLERDITDKEVRKVLRTGYVEEPPVPGSGKNEWKCEVVQQQDNSNREIGVITIIIEEQKLFIKTIMFKDFS